MISLASAARRVAIVLVVMSTSACGAHAAGVYDDPERLADGLVAAADRLAIKSAGTPEARDEISILLMDAQARYRQAAHRRFVRGGVVRQPLSRRERAVAARLRRKVLATFERQVRSAGALPPTTMAGPQSVPLPSGVLFPELPPPALPPPVMPPPVMSLPQEHCPAVVPFPAPTPLLGVGAKF